MRRNVHLTLIACLLALVVFVSLPAHAALAATRTVTKTADTNDGVCDADCSLREAIAVAAPGDTITFDPALSGQTIILTIGSLSITKSLTIDGSSLASPISVSGNDERRVFSIGSNVTITFTALDIINGYAPSSTYGGGMYINAANTVVNLNSVTMSGNQASGGAGGAMYIQGSAVTVNIQNSTFSGNGTGNATNGSAIINIGMTLNVTASTFASNGAGTGSSSGAIFNYNNGMATVTNSTFTGNNTGTGLGAAVMNDVGSTITIRNSTISGNTGANAFYNNGTASVYNSIFANSAGGPDCQGIAFAANAGNLIETRTGCSAPAFTADPLLGPLANNSGPTQTMALLPGSPAIDSGDNPTCAPTDQRGVTRPQNVVCDIGAFEVDNTSPSVTLTSSASDPTNLSPIPVTITFSEAVTGFVAGDLTVGNGTAGNFSGSGTNYTVDITPSADGLVTVDIAAGVAIDAAGNGNTAADQFSVTYDGTAPGVTITSPAPDPTNTAPIPLTITFSEPVTGFVAGDLTVGNGAAGSFSGSGAAYTVNITPAADGLVTVDIAAGVAADAAGNGNTAAAQFSITYDNTGPGVTITSSAPDPTNSAPIPLTITFSEPVTGFVVGDLTVGNGAAGSFSGSGAAYTVDITPAADGLTTVDIAAGVAADAAGNGNTVALQFSITYDTTGPGVTITSSAPDPTNTAPIPVTITFSEPVTGLVVGDLTVGNGTAGSFSGSGAAYTVDITPAADGLVTVDIAAGVAIDAAGNGNTVALQFSITYDTTGPGVTITSSAPDPTNTAPIPVTITFSEAVTGFVIGDLTVGNGTAGSFSGSGAAYTVDITPAADGLVTVDVAAAVAEDAAGNGNTVALQFSITYDTTGPGVTITSSASDPTNLSPIPVTITFSESVTGFEVGDLTVGNGTAGNFSGSGAAYTVDITPAADGLVTVDVAAAVAVDAAGNSNTAALQFSVTYDGTAPGVTLTSLAPDPTNTTPIPVTITFSEPVTGFVVGDLTVGNGTAGNFSGSGAAYTVDITPAADGPVTVDIASGVAADAAGNGNTAALQFSITYDGTAPSVIITSSASDPTNLSPIPLTITFSESVTGFDISDLTLGNGTAGNFSGSGAAYTVDITPDAEGPVTVDIAAGVALDLVGNGNTAADQFSVTYDTTAPSVTITSSAPDPTNLSPIPLTITFSEAVTGFEVGDLTVGNGTAGNFSGSSATYTVDITPAADGLVTVDLAAGVATDAAGNGNTAAAQFSITFNGTPPEVTITSSSPDPTNAAPIPVIITFSEAVNGFELGDLTVGNGTAGSLSGSGAIYSADITPAVDGLVTVDIAAAVAFDESGNGNVAAAQFSITFDTTPPTATVNPLPGTVLETFTVSWSGEDTLSGIAYFDVQVQQDGGVWTDWQSNTSATSAQFTGEVGSLYAFRVRAEDLAGNVGAWSPPVQTRVSLGIYLPIIRRAP